MWLNMQILHITFALQYAMFKLLCQIYSYKVLFSDAHDSVFNTEYYAKGTNEVECGDSHYTEGFVLCHQLKLF